ncbi:MAG: hypothetical protein QNJ74_24580 [Trichodesmium sp. MO_231.B1]|nr:hypothetical protein [Trichodesmium sp. MO_231.B1]
MAEPITIVGSAAFIVAVKAYCAAHFIPVSMSIIMKCAVAYLTGGKSAAIDVAIQDQNASSAFVDALRNVL